MTASYDPKQTHDLKIFELEYGKADGEPLLARVCQPQGPGPFPGLLFVHGGAWSSGTRMEAAPFYERLAASGLVVVAIEFRLAPAHAYPGGIEDINYGTRWVKAHAADLNIDPLTLGGLGSSSGGHQAMLSAMRPKDPRYQVIPLTEVQDVDASLAYVVACWPILDPYARYFFAHDTDRDLLVNRTETYFLSFEALKEGNPQLILDRGEPVAKPPVLIIQGTEDTNVRPEMQQRFAAAYEAAGGECQLEIFPGMPHGSDWPADRANHRDRVITTFIERQLAELPATV